MHDLVLAAGVYAVIGFEVTPATVIGLLTILGFSLYDTVVVFDKIDENTRGLLSGSRSTYSEAANRAVNQTLMRSINTSIIALLPVAGLLFVGAGLLGAGTLKDLALVLFIGMAAGAYSSIFLAAPIVCDFIERQPEFVALRKRVLAKRAAAAKAAGGATPAAERPTPARRRAGAAGTSPARSAKATPGSKPAAGTGTIELTKPGEADSPDEAEPLQDAVDDVSEPPVHPVARAAGQSPRPGARPQRPARPASRPAQRGRPSGKKR